MSLPLVSVVTPSYGYARFIGQCLSSVRRQTYPRIEHLVLDACSPDGTEEVVRGFLGTYDLQAFFEKDGGQADAINKGFARARGDVLCWLNADDYWLHDRVVEEAVAALEQGADLVSATGRFVDEDGKVGKRFDMRPSRLVRELRYYDTVLQPATFWRRSVHRTLRTDLHYAFDWWLWLEMVDAGCRFAGLDREWAAYRMHSSNKTSLDPARRRREVVEIHAARSGRASPQYLWARGLYEGYRLAEDRNLPALKWILQKANVAMHYLTARRVFSC